MSRAGIPYRWQSFPSAMYPLPSRSLGHSRGSLSLASCHAGLGPPVPSSPFHSLTSVPLLCSHSCLLECHDLYTVPETQIWDHL